AGENRTEETMKKQILNVVVTLSVIATLSIAVFARLTTSLKANIPFDFSINEKTLPAGHYTVEPTTSGTLMIRNWESKRGVLVIAQSCEVSAHNKLQLIFHRYGNQYFLAKALGDTNGSELMKSKAEREATKAR